MSEKSLRNGANHGFLVPAKAVSRTTGSLAMEPMHKRSRAEANGSMLVCSREGKMEILDNS